jgi:hypothetical protein
VRVLGPYSSSRGVGVTRVSIDPSLGLVGKRGYLSQSSVTR